MNRYIALLERAVSKLPPGRLDERQSVYEQARNAIYETFAGPENVDTRAEEFRLLEESIENIEERIAQGRFPIRDEIAAAPLSAPPAAEQAAQAAPITPTREVAGTPTVPGGSLFAQGRAPLRASPSRDVEEDETSLPLRVRVLGLLLFVGAAGLFFLVRPDFLSAPRVPLRPPIQPSPPARSPVIKLQTLQWTGTGGAKGTVSWTMEADSSSFAPRRTTRQVLVGRADLTPLAPPVRIYFVPAGDDGFKATHFLELRFDDDPKLGVAVVQSVKIGIGQGDAVEPEGVVIRTAGYGHAFVFSNVPKEAIVNDALLSRAEEFVISLRLESGATPVVTIPTVKLKSDGK